jgi:hypothetical protein
VRRSGDDHRGDAANGDLVDSGGLVCVDLLANATLDMNGHSITGPGGSAVLCEAKRCTPIGPGEISGHGDRIRTWARRTVLQNLSLHDNGDRAIDANGGVVIAQALTVTHNGFGSTRSGGPEYSFAIAGDALRATNAIVSDNAGFGILRQQFQVDRNDRRG